MQEIAAGTNRHFHIKALLKKNLWKAYHTDWNSNHLKGIRLVNYYMSNVWHFILMSMGSWKWPHVSCKNQCCLWFLAVFSASEGEGKRTASYWSVTLIPCLHSCFKAKELVVFMHIFSRRVVRNANQSVPELGTHSCEYFLQDPSSDVSENLERRSGIGAEP